MLASHKEQTSIIRQYITWRNSHACDERLSRVAGALLRPGRTG